VATRAGQIVGAVTAPSFVLRLTWRRYSNRSNSFGMLDALTLWPIPRSAAASFSWLFDTHRSGRIGSPIVAGSK